MERPDIFAYTDYRAWLRAWFDYKNGKPSKRAFAKKAGCSPATLVSVMSATRDLAPDLAERVCGLTGLDPEERIYFLDLVEYEQAPVRVRKLAALARIMGARRFRGAQRGVDAAYLATTHWYAAAMIELVRCTGFRDDAAWIASTLRPEITVEEVEETLQSLVGGGMLVRDENGRLQPVEAIWAMDREVKQAMSALAASFHREMLATAIAALDGTTPEERHFSTVTLAIPSRLLPEIKQAVGRFVEEMTGRYAEGEPPDTVVQLSVQLWPLSGRTIS